MDKSIAIVDLKTCYGCCSCYSACKFSAIEMNMNEEGFYFPSINTQKCTNCGMCSRVCPAINVFKNELRDNCFYSYQNDNNTVLQGSTSGGLFSAIVECFPEAYIVGAVYSKNHVDHILSNNKKDVERMRGSKYVQSYLGSIFCDVKSKLENDQQVVFSGTSCQVDALNRFLKEHKVNTEKLVTLDLICHGVPSPGVYSSFIVYYEKKHNKKIKEQYFRSKRFGWGVEKGAANYLQSFQTDNNNTIMDYDINIWQNIFFCDCCIRESCYQCPYTCINKPADITMGDFWNIKSVLPDLSETKSGYSLAISHSEKGRAILEGINALRIDSEKNDSLVNLQPRLIKPITRPQNREAFWEDYKVMNFDDLAKKYYRYNRKNKFLYKIWLISNKLRMSKISAKLARVIFI